MSSTRLVSGMTSHKRSHVVVSLLLLWVAALAIDPEGACSFSMRPAAINFKLA